MDCTATIEPRLPTTQGSIVSSHLWVQGEREERERWRRRACLQPQARWAAGEAITATANTIYEGIQCDPQGSREGHDSLRRKAGQQDGRTHACKKHPPPNWAIRNVEVREWSLNAWIAGDGLPNLWRSIVLGKAGKGGGRGGSDAGCLGPWFAPSCHGRDCFNVWVDRALFILALLAWLSHPFLPCRYWHSDARDRLGELAEASQAPVACAECFPCLQRQKKPACPRLHFSTTLGPAPSPEPRPRQAAYPNAYPLSQLSCQKQQTSQGMCVCMCVYMRVCACVYVRVVCGVWIFRDWPQEHTVHCHRHTQSQ